MTHAVFQIPPWNGNRGGLQSDEAKRELLRQIYDKYDGWVKVGGANSITVSDVVVVVGGGVWRGGNQ